MSGSSLSAQAAALPPESIALLPQTVVVLDCGDKIIIRVGPTAMDFAVSSGEQQLGGRTVLIEKYFVSVILLLHGRLSVCTGDHTSETSAVDRRSAPPSQ